MTTHCPACRQWSALPPDLGVASGVALVLPKCEHCGAALPVEGRYGLCGECGRHHRTDYEVCPFKVEGISTGAPVDEVAAGPYSIEAQKRRPKKRSEEYYWQLYFDYRDKLDENAEFQVPGSEPESEEPPHPADMPVHISDYAPAGNGHGHSQPGYGNGSRASGANSTNGNGNGNGYGNGNGKKGVPPQAARVDLAVADNVSLTLFPEIDLASASLEEIAPVKVGAGNYNEFEYELISDPSRLAEVAELLASEKVVGIDTETTGLDPHTSELLLLQISTTDKVYIVDCRRVVPLALKAFLENQAVMKVAQNAKFEYVMLRQQAGITVNNMFDTMLAERLLMAGIGREISLKAIAQKYIGATLDKSVRESFYKLAMHGDAYLAPEQLHYAARDAFIMIPIWRQMMPELKKHKLLPVAELEFMCIPAVGDLELAGVRIDTERWRKIIADVAVQREKSAEELSELLAPASMQATMFGVPSINLNSNMQLLEAFVTLGVNLPDTMEATLVKFDHPAVAKLLEYRSHEKTLSAFGENVLGLINPKTGRIHPDFNQYGADTGRFSCIAGDTLISTTKGLRRIDEIKATDYVQTSFGPREALASWCNGVRPLMKVTLSDGRVLRLTSDHRVLTGQGSTWKPVSDLSVGDNMFLSLREADLDGTVPVPTIEIDPGTYYAKRKATIPTALSVELCELAGLITADGTFVENQSHRTIRGKRGVRFTKAHYDRVIIDFGWGDEQLIEKVIGYSSRLFGIPFVEHRHKTARRLQLASTQVSNALANLGLSGTAHTKRVPNAILSAQAIFQAAYLRGLFEGDGHITKDGEHVGLTSVNRELLETVQSMLSFLGCYASIRERKDSSGFSGAPRYALGIPGSENVTRFMRIVGFMSSRKNERALNARRTPAGSVTPIRISGAKLYREAVLHGMVTPSRKSVKPFIPYYKASPQGTTTLDKLLERWGDLPELEMAKSYRQRALHCVRVVSIEPDGVGPVYDLTVDGVSEFLANGLVVHNCTKPNVQQIPATSDFRKCFVAAPGYKLITCDYSQCELRVLAELSGDPAFVDAFTSGQDLHTLTASQMFGVPVDQVQKPQRSAAKAINFGLAYGMGPGGLAPRLGVTLDEAKSLISKYFAAYPGIQRWLDKAAKDAVRLGYSATPLGRKRFYNLPDESLKRHNEDEWRKQIAAIERQGKNSPIQGCVVGSTRIFEETHGYVPIESLRGQVVSVWDGSEFSQAVVVYSGQKQLVRIRLWDGNNIECSPDHRFLVRPTTGNDMWKTPGEFKPQNRLILGEAVPDWALEPTMPTRRYSPVWNAKDVSLRDIGDSVALGEWLGRLASDGSLHDGAACLLVAEHEEVLLPRLREISERLGHVGYSVRSTVEKPKRFHRLNISSRAIVHELRALGIKERVPDCAWQNGPLLAAYLRGMFDGDGTVNNDGAFLVFGQGSKHLNWAREIQQALLLFGIRSRVNVCADRVNVR
ncbi:MAG: DNA polymerase, partial [Chloroflexia bacterium]